MKNLKLKLHALIQLNKIFWEKAKGVFIYNILNSIIIGPCISVTGLIMIQLVMNALLDGKSNSYIVWLIIFLSGVQIAGNFTQMAIAYFLLERINLKVRLSITRDFLNKIKRIDYCYLDEPKYLDILQYVSDNLSKQVMSAHGLLITLLLNISTIIAVCSIVIQLEMPVIIAISLIYAIIVTVLRNIITKIGFEKNQEFIPSERRCSYYQSIFKNRDMAQDIRCTELSNIILSEYDNSVSSQERTIKKYATKLAVPAMGNIGSSALLTCCCLIYISLSIRNNILFSITVLPTLFESYRNLASNLNSIFKCDAQLVDLSLFFSKYQELMQIDCTIENKVENHNDSNVYCKPFDIEFNNVFFTYPNSGFSLKNFSFHINKGETIGIVGVNGAGKTTLTKLLLRLYDVDSGEIYINGTNIKDLNLMSLREHIGYSPQSPNLYSMSFRQNLSLYGEQQFESEKDLLDAFEFERIFDKFHGDVNSQVTKQFDANGIMLSGGEIQKLSIARTYEKKFGLLIFDEPTSALDPISEKEMMDMIYQRANTSTTIIIAHRMSTIKKADRIIVLENGTIIESGTHTELIELNGKYKEMYYVQGENYQLAL